MTTRQAQIDSKLCSVGEVLKGDFRYKVPLHQRNFSWALEQVGELWEDILDAIQNDLPEYFLGTIVVQENREQKTRTIIDGQQRLASLMMIFAGIRRVYAEENDDRHNEIYHDYLGIRDRRTRVTEPRLSLNEVNESAFQDLVVEDVLDEFLESATKDKTSAPSNLVLSRAAHFIRNRVRQKAKGALRYEDFLLELEEFIRDRVIIILVVVGDEADAYLIFETLNDRGLELSISDLLKNYIFGRAGNRLDVVRKQWLEMAVILGTQDQTQFLRHFWLSKYGVIRERDLYREMKQKFASQSAVLRLMNELRDAVDKYAAMSDAYHPIWAGYSSSVRRDLETLQLFGLSQFRPLLLAALSVMEEKCISSIVHMIVVVSMRYSIIGAMGTGNIEKAYSDAAIQIRDRRAERPAKVFALLKGIYPDDSRFEADFSEKEIAKGKLARYILAAIANKAQGSKELGVLEDENCVTLEHIMPKTRSNEWQQAAKDENEYLDCVNRLGNLTLIERETNKVAGNASFADKRASAFAQSDILITKQLCSKDQWTVAEIESRQRELAKIAVQVWALPY